MLINTLENKRQTRYEDSNPPEKHSRIPWRFATLALIVVIAIAFSGCNDPGGEAYTWLAGLANNTGAPPPTGTTEFVVQVDDVAIDNSAFIFETTRTIGLDVSVFDPENSIQGSIVEIRELESSPSPGSLLFRAVTGPNGNIAGSFTVNINTSIVNLLITVRGITYKFEVDIANVQFLRRILNFKVTITPVQVIQDSDGDGVPDDMDTYPDDPTRASMVRYPPVGYYTVAYEDLYPRKGDADFNDYVLRVVQEEDLNATGEVVRIRGNYQHVAKGAGYDHTLHLSLPGVTAGASLNMERKAPDGTVLATENRSVEGIFSGIRLMPRSSGTIPASNTAPNTTFKPGDTLDYEIIPTSPTTRMLLGSPPYDLFIRILKNRKELDLNGVILNILRVEAHGPGRKWFTVNDFGPAGKVVDILSLKNGAFLGPLNLAAGRYTQLRLILGLKNSIIVDEGSGYTQRPLFVPSGTKTGIKIVGPFDIPESGEAVIKLDFDAVKSIRRSGSTYRLRPVIRVKEVVTPTPDQPSGVYIGAYSMLNREVHFAGKYYRNDGTDLYLDTDGFPWALMVPGQWKWPYERDDIRNGYPNFDDWYLSEGRNFTDWFTVQDPAFLYPTGE